MKAHRMTREEGLALLDFAGDATHELFELAPGKVIRVRGATAGEFFKYVVRRNAAERANFIDGVAKGEALGKALREKLKAEGREEATPEELKELEDQEVELDMVAFANAKLDSGPEGMAALCAVCVEDGQFAGDEVFEARLIRHPRFTALYAVANRMTRGADPSGFSQAVGDMAWGRIPTEISTTSTTPSETSPSPSETASAA